MRGQVGTETLMVIGIAVVLIMAVIYTVLPMMFDFTQYSENSKIETSLFKLKGTIESVSSYGPGTETDLMLYFPEGEIKNNENMLIFEKTNGDSVLVQVDVPFEIKGELDVIGGINNFKILKPENVDEPVLIE
jgi:imidazolonepropionase-like amidohydrolase